MPILLPPELPAFSILQAEGYDVQPSTTGKQRTRIGLVNLMPVKQTTEHHFARVLSHSLTPVELVLLKLKDHQSKNTPAEHLEQFYRNWQERQDSPLDGVIVTGAPVEHLPFQEVTYWQELQALFDWLREKRIPSLFICWGAQAALHHYVGLEKHTLPHKALGLFPHHIRHPSPLLLGFDDEFGVPVARNTEVRAEDIAQHAELTILSDSHLSGVYVVQHKTLPHFYVFNHLEYTSDTIVEEYFREIQQGKNQPVPYNYFPDGNPKNQPLNRWRSHAALLYSNWVREAVQQQASQIRPLTLAIAGLGHVGSEVVRTLYRQRELIEQRTGRPIRIAAVSARQRSKTRHLPELEQLQWVDDPLQLCDLPEVDVIVEVIGGAEGIARQLVEKALSQGKHVVTANKALLAHHGVQLIAKAEANSLRLAFEAAVGGGVPMLKTLREALASDRVVRFSAILNGTANFILSRMEQQNMPFAEALAEAQALGYAEADPTMDVDGFDTAHKLNILSCIAFGCNIRLEDMPIHGIRQLQAQDIQAARTLGYSIKLLATAIQEDGQLDCRVEPQLVPLQHPLAQTDNVYNGLQLHTVFAGDLYLRGAGAGGQPTAAAVLADVVDIATGRGGYPFGIPAADVRQLTPHGQAAQPRAYYLRFAHKPGSLSLNIPPLKQSSTLSDGQYIAITHPILADDLPWDALAAAYPLAVL